MAFEAFMDSSSDMAIPLSNSIIPAGAYLLHGRTTSMEPYVCLASTPIMCNVSSEAEILSQLYQGGQQSRKRQYLENTTASVNLASLEPQTRLDSLPIRIIQETGNLIPFHKKTKFDVDRETIQQQVIQNLLMKELQDCNPQLKAMIELHRQQNQLQQPILRSVSQLMGLHPQLPKEMPGHPLQNNGNQEITSLPLLDGDICSRRFKQYMYHLHHHPKENNIAYWRNFVSEYYAPGSKKRWCFSMYESNERHATGVFCPKSMEMWCCELCGSRSGKGLEAPFEIFPRLFNIKYESGMLDEILFLDMPLARKISSGVLVLEYRKAIQESIYEKFRVIHEGKLRVVFRHDLKILSWEFCAQKHDEFLLRRLVAPQVDQFVCDAQRFDNSVQNGARVRVHSEELQENCDAFVSAGQSLAREMDVPLVNDLGYPKTFVRCLQIGDVVNTMKDLISFSHVNKMAPIESLKKYSQLSNMDGRVIQKQQEMQQFMVARNLQVTPVRPCPQRPESRSRMIDNGQLYSSRNSGLALADHNNQLPGGQNTCTSLVTSASRERQEFLIMNNSNLSADFLPSFYSNDAPYTLQRSPLSEHSKAPHQVSQNTRNPHHALISKLLQDRLLASSRGNSANELKKQTSALQADQIAFRNAAVRLSSNFIASKQSQGETSNAGRANDNATRAGKLPRAASHANLSAVSRGISVKIEPNLASRGISVKIEPNSPELFHSSENGICEDENMQW